jgi:integrase/recombinase XerD
MIIHVEQSKGRKDRLVMLSPETLALLREWWKVRPSFYDGGVPVQERLFFPGRKPGQPLTTRQLNRLFHQTTHAAGIRKAVNLHSLRTSMIAVSISERFRRRSLPPVHDHAECGCDRGHHL